MHRNRKDPIMTQEQATRLSVQIVAQFPRVETAILQQTDTRNAPANWFIAVKRTNALVEGMSLFIHSQYEWQEALTALYVLQA